MARRIDRPFTGKYEIGDAVKVVDGGNYNNPIGVVLDIRPDKRSHHYQVKMDGYLHKLWFCEDELQVVYDIPGISQ